MTSSDQPYDALLLLSFGGPEGPDDVMPFLRNVTRGRGIPDERLATVAEHYGHFHGVSPINEQNRALIDALHDELARRGHDLPIYWGNRNWKPYVADAVRQMRDDNVRSAVVFATSATSSYSSCRQYREDLAQARMVAGEGSPELVKIRHFFDHPGFVAANADGVRAALDALPAEHRDTARLVFTAHSIPQGMNDQSGPERSGLYAAEQRETARLTAESVRGAGAEFDLVWQSRSGPPQVPWLEPDINDRGLVGGGRPGRGGRADRFRVRPHRGALGPRQRGQGDRRPPGPGLRPRCHRRHAPGVRRRGVRPDRGAHPRGRAAVPGQSRAVRHRLSGRLLPRAATPLGSRRLTGRGATRRTRVSLAGRTAPGSRASAGEPPGSGSRRPGSRGQG